MSVSASKRISSDELKSTRKWPPIWTEKHQDLILWHTHTHTHTRKCTWNHTGWRLCQINNTDWSLMLNFLEVLVGLSASCTCSEVQLPPGWTVGWMEIRESISIFFPARRSLWLETQFWGEKRRDSWEQWALEIGWIHFLRAMRSCVLKQKTLPITHNNTGVTNFFHIALGAEPWG